MLRVLFRKELSFALWERIHTHRRNLNKLIYIQGPSSWRYGTLLKALFNRFKIGRWILDRRIYCAITVLESFVFTFIANRDTIACAYYCMCVRITKKSLSEYCGSGCGMYSKWVMNLVGDFIWCEQWNFYVRLRCLLFVFK